MKRKILLISLVIMLVIALLINTVNAASFIATMTASKTTVAESTEFTVTIKVSNIDAGTNGINSISGIFSYDSKIFEAITSSSISGLNGWQPSYFPDTGKIVLLKTSFTKNDEDVLQVTLKTKASTSGKSGVVSFKSVTAANSDTDIQASDISTTITVGNASTSIGEGNTSTNTNTPQTINTSRPVTNTNVNTNTKTNTNVVNNTITSSTVNTTKSNNSANNVVVKTGSDIPYTGTSDNIMIAIFVVLAIAGISYFKYESIKDN